MNIKVVKGGRTVKDGTYDAVVEDVEERREDDKHFLLFFFKLIAGPYQGTRLSGLVSPVLDEGTDLDRWLTAILGRKVEDGEELDLEKALPGRRCRVRVETVSKGRRCYSNVVEVSAPRA